MPVDWKIYERLLLLHLMQDAKTSKDAMEMLAEAIPDATPKAITEKVAALRREAKANPLSPNADPTTFATPQASAKKGGRKSAAKVSDDDDGTVPTPTKAKAPKARATKEKTATAKATKPRAVKGKNANGKATAAKKRKIAEAEDEDGDEGVDHELPESPPEPMEVLPGLPGEKAEDKDPFITGSFNDAYEEMFEGMR